MTLQGSHSSPNGADHQQPGWELFPHPSYSPDLAPSDSHLIGLLKEFTRDTEFENVDEVKSVVSD